MFGGDKFQKCPILKIQKWISRKVSIGGTICSDTVGYSASTGISGQDTGYGARMKKNYVKLRHSFKTGPTTSSRHSKNIQLSSTLRGVSQVV